VGFDELEVLLETHIAYLPCRTTRIVYQALSMKMHSTVLGVDCSPWHDAPRRLAHLHSIRRFLYAARPLHHPRPQTHSARRLIAWHGGSVLRVCSVGRMGREERRLALGLDAPLFLTLQLFDVFGRRRELQQDPPTIALHAACPELFGV